MIDLKTFAGIIDTDSPNENIGQKAIKTARNIRYRGDKSGSYRVENIEGTRQIPYDLPAGKNECVGRFYDDIKKRVVYFNYNSNSNHGIYIIDLGTETITPLLVSGTNTDGDILNFTLDEPVFAVKILYGDAVQGDTIYFNNSQKEPCQINIERTLANTYGIMKRDFLEVIKYPANRPPYVTYGNDATVTVNSMRKKLFKFKVRNRFYSKETSVTSTQSEVALPLNANISTTDQDPTKNCKISIVYETGDADVKSIELLGAVSTTNQFSDFFLIQTINKVELGIPDNDLAIFDFYNNQAYLDIDAEESIQLMDLVPLEANALEMLNGKVLIYGGTTEGFDLITLDASTEPDSLPQQNMQVPFVFVGTQSGSSAFGNEDADIHIIFIGDAVTNVTTGQEYTFVIETTNETISYTPGAPTNAIIAGLEAAAITAGFTVVSSDANNLIINKSGESLQSVSNTTVLNDNVYTPAYNWNDRGSYSLVYFDKAGRTNGVITDLDLPYQTVNYTETSGIPNLPQQTLTITSRPPDWAYYFSIVRTKSLAKFKFLYWVTDNTEKDSEFAYVSIENLNLFIKRNPSAKFLAYDLSAGDRIRFIKLLDDPTAIYTNNDFEIVAQILNPTINGIAKTGQYLKIALPTTASDFDFGTSAFANYQVEIYTPAQSVQNDLNKSYEFGETYTIGDAGLATRYHQGMIQNQTPNLAQAAIFEFNKGDNYFRYRSINVGADYNYTIPTYEQGIGRTTMAAFFNDQSYSDPTITPGDSINASLVGFDITTNTDRAILNISVAATSAYVFRVTGSINVTFNAIGEAFSYYLEDSSSNITYLVPTQMIGQGPHVFTFDVNVILQPNTRLFLFAYSDGDNTNSKQYITTTFKITRDRTFTVPVIDANYSDYFESKVNSNGRPLVEEPTAGRLYNPILLRWGLPNVINTNVNQISRFTVTNFDEINLTYGDIEVLYVENATLNILQRRGCGWYGVYSKIIQDNTGTNTLVTTENIITKNNIQYLAGNYGVGNQKWSFVKAKTGYYFIDPIRGYMLRKGGDGLTPVNEIYFGRFEIRNLLTPYENDYTRITGGLSKITSYFDYFEEQYVVVLQGGVYDGKTILPESLAFNEVRKGYATYFDYGEAGTEWMICAADKTLSWNKGQLYIHDKKGNGYTEFYGKKYNSSITVVFNSKEAVKKTFHSIGYQSNQIWQSDFNGDILTSQINPDTLLPQISQLQVEDYEVNEGVTYAAFLRDANSGEDARVALVEGDYLKGEWLQVKLTYKGNNFVFLYGLYTNWVPSPRTF
jgi:hypothetical protein